MRLTAREPGSGGRLDPDPEDFEVDEALPYRPSGVGEHVFVRIEKRGLDTLEAARRLARHLGAAPPTGPLPLEIGLAGLKDRHAVARQWLSLPWSSGSPLPEPGPVSDGLELLEAERHGHKLRRGHVASNRFAIVVRGVPEGGVERARDVLERLRVTGVPNPFGPQRFGAEGDNADRARAILAGRARRPKEGRVHRLLLSALQSEVFNRVLDLRIEGSMLALALTGDRMVKHATGGQFIVDDGPTEQPRADALEISPTGPLVGKKTPPTKGIVAEMEASALEAAGLDRETARRLGPGGRRPLRYPLDPEARVEPAGEGAYRLCVTLPSGAYATSLLDELVKPEDGPLTRALGG